MGDLSILSILNSPLEKGLLTSLANKWVILKSSCFEKLCYTGWYTSGPYQKLEYMKL
jgi:hypothetical protein